MVRTRDFVLFILILIVLVLAISVTAWFRSDTGQMAYWWNASDNQTTDAIEFSAQAPAAPDDYEDKLSRLRDKINERLSLRAPAVRETAVPEVADDSTQIPVVATTTATGRPQNCDSYRSLNISWNPAMIKQENREGMRLYYETIALNEDGTEQINVRTALPMRTWQLMTTSCITYDVIGIAIDGSLIKNNEVSLYGVFGADTLIGYALDGFPIYGAGAVSRDVCGGAQVDGFYRYVLDKASETIITCYSGVPVTIQ